MPWMRVAIGVGAAALVAGVTGMVLWIDGSSHYFGVAAVLASAGFLTLVACFLTSVFGSSHGSQDDAFRLGKSVGYDEGFLEGHRTARPVVVPLLGAGPDVDHELEVASSEDMGREDECDDARESPLAALPMWHRETMPLSRWGARDRMFHWVVARRVVLVAGAMCLALIGVLVANALVPPARSAVALTPGTQSLSPDPPSGSTPALVSKTGRSGLSVSVGTGGTLLVPGVAGAPPVVPGLPGGSPVVPGLAGASRAAQAVAGSVSVASGLPGVAVVGSSPVDSPSSPVYSPPAVSPVTVPTVVPVVAPPVVASPVVRLTTAQQTAADAAAAAALTAANAKSAAALTAANARSAADLTAANALASAKLTAANAAAAAAETARVAAAAAEATKLKAAADAYAVAHSS